MTATQRSIIIAGSIVVACVIVAVGVLFAISQSSSATKIAFAAPAERIEFGREQVNGVEVRKHEGRWALVIGLKDGASKSFASFTERNVGKQVRILVDGELMTTVRVTEPVRSGRLRITSSDEAKLRRIAGKLGS